MKKKERAKKVHTSIINWFIFFYLKFNYLIKLNQKYYYYIQRNFVEFLPMKMI